MLAPLRDRGLSALALRLLERIGLGQMAAIATPYDQPSTRRCGVAGCHRAWGLRAPGDGKHNG